MADYTQAKPSEPDAVDSRETGRAAVRVRRGARPLAFLPVLALLLFGIVWIVALDTSWALWVVLAGILLVTVGVVIALNPRRSSPTGGTARR